MANYFVIGGDGKEYGPVTEADVRQWIAEGRLNGDSRVKVEGDTELRALRQVPELAAVLTTASPAGGKPLVSPSSETSEVDWQADVLAREAELRLGECLGAGWSFLAANAGFLAGAVLLTWLANLVLVVISVTVPLIGPFVLLCFNGVLMGGFYAVCLRRGRGEAVSPIETFNGFTSVFPQLLLAGLVSALLVEFSFCFLILPAIYLAVAWQFALPLVADKKLFFWTGMELSRKIVTRVWFEAAVLLVIVFLPMIVCFFFNVVFSGRYFLGLYDRSNHDFSQLAQLMQTERGDLKKLTWQMTAIGQGVFLVNLFYAIGVIVRAYENLFGPRKP
jgi:hypothetical protein